MGGPEPRTIMRPVTLMLQRDRAGEDHVSSVGPLVLVAYATRFGSTADVAEHIADVLRDAGMRVVLRRTQAVDSVAAYDAVVFGSPVFDQQWLPDADELVQRNLRALATRPVWLFSVGTFGDRKRVIGRLMRREPRNIASVRAAIEPRGYRVFAGVIDRAQWPLPSRALYHLLGGRLGDNRDWDEIGRWAREIAAALRAQAAR